MIQSLLMLEANYPTEVKKDCFEAFDAVFGSLPSAELLRRSYELMLQLEAGTVSDEELRRAKQGGLWGQEQNIIDVDLADDILGKKT